MRIESITGADTLRSVLASVVVDGSDPIRLRAVSALLADHRVDRIGIVGASPPSSWGDRVARVASPEGFGIVVGLTPSDSQVSVTAGPDGTVSWAGPTGLTRSLGTQLEDAALAATVPGSPLRDGPRFGFPSPIGWLHGRDSDGINQCPHASDLAAVMAVTANGRSLAIVDNQAFLDACSLAAGVVVALQGHRGPVWDIADAYLDTAVSMGLVVADRS